MIAVVPARAIAGVDAHGAGRDALLERAHLATAAAGRAARLRRRAAGAARAHAVAGVAARRAVGRALAVRAAAAVDVEAAAGARARRAAAGARAAARARTSVRSSTVCGFTVARPARDEHQRDSAETQDPVKQPHGRNANTRARAAHTGARASRRSTDVQRSAARALRWGGSSSAMSAAHLARLHSRKAGGELGSSR